jgi:membrane protease YdiL (CAAX protease family)
MEQTDQENTIINESNDSPIFAEPAYPNVRALIKLFFVLFLYMIAGGILLGLFAHEITRLGSSLLKSLLSLLSYVITFLVTIRYAIKKSKKQQPYSFSIGFNKIQGWVIPVLIISTLAFVVNLEHIADLIPMPDSVQKFFESVFKKDIFSVITIVIAAPVLEEILCRGIILQGLLKNYSPNKAILISALFFAIMHLNPWQALPAFFGGLFLGWIYYKTRSVIPGMIIHATINATATAFLFLPKQQQSLLNLLGKPYYIVLCLFSVIVFVAGCALIHRKVKVSI